MKSSRYPSEVVALIRAAKNMPGEEAILEPCDGDGTCVVGIKKRDILALQKALKGVGAHSRQKSSLALDVARVAGAQIRARRGGRVACR